MGDHKLKLDKDYIAPEGERVDAKRKRLQILEAQEEMLRLRKAFNEDLLALRDRKRAVLETVSKKQARISALAAKLKKHVPWQGNLRSCSLACAARSS